MNTFFAKIISFITAVFTMFSLIFTPAKPVEGEFDEVTPVTKQAFDEGEFTMGEYDIVVSPDGNDSNNGSLENPLKTFEAAKEKLKALTLWKSATTEFVCHRYHCSARSLRRWRKIYDGTLASLENKSHRPLTPHPNSQTEEEKQHIQNLIKRNSHIGLNELYGKLRIKYNYKRNPVTLYRYLRKIGFYLQRGKHKTYKAKPYDTPQKIGVKWQLDVKYVPFECKSTLMSGEDRFYQYTVIDEATRQRFIYPYRE